jgi:hypothetical protein
MAEEEVCIPVQLDGSVGTTSKRIDGLKSGKYIEVYIENTHASNILYLSMDGEQHWKKITAANFIRMRGTAKHPLLIKDEDFHVKGSAENTTYELILLKIA